MFSFTEENYLKAIYHLEHDSNGGVSTNAIAEKMNTKPSSATDMVQKLAEKKAVFYERYKGTFLTGSGKKTAAKIIRKHRLWEVFLMEKLDFQWDEVHEMAEQLEHIQSDKLIKRLDRYLGHPDFDPHGDPIPDENGKIKPSDKKLLSKLKKGEIGICVGVKESSKEFLQYLDKIHISLGSKITVLSKEFFDNSMIILVGKKQVSVSNKLTDNLFIKKGI
jgi:DtxR family Mn-dependent transcriptional regulator